MSSQPTPKGHSSLNPRTNILLITVWATAIAFCLFVLKPHIPIALAIVGGGFGAIAGFMQHGSFTQARDQFVQASSLLDVRRVFKGTAWGRRYIAWLYLSKFGLLALVVESMARGPFLHMVFGYAGAHASLMFVRELVTLGDTIALHSANPAQ